MFGPAMRRFGHGTDLLSEMQHLHNEMSRLFSSVAPQTVHEYPLVNVWSGENDAIVTAEMPGVDPTILDISVIGDTLAISGKNEPEDTNGGGIYHRQERNYGYFKRILQLPFHVDAEKVEARYEKGILQIKLPRAEDDKPRKVMIHAE